MKSQIRKLFQFKQMRKVGSNLLSSLGMIVLIIANLLVLGFYFNSTRNYHLQGKGLNLACQSPNLSPLDYWVCTNGRLNKTFILYSDASPYYLYRDLLNLPKYQDISFGRMSRNLGLLDSGPSFRSSLIGRLDIDYAQEMNDFDNIFHQTTKFNNQSI
jgi:hypothetical protein